MSNFNNKYNKNWTRCSELVIKYFCISIKKNQHFSCTLLGGEGGGHEKVYPLYTCENVDNCEGPLNSI